MFPYNLPNSKNLSLPNIKYLWFLLPFSKIWLLPDDEISTKLTMREIALRGTFIAIIITIPSLVAFVLTWVFLDDLIYGFIFGALVYFIAIVVSLKISKKFLIKR